MSEATTLFKSTGYKRRKRDLLLSIKQASKKIQNIKGSESSLLVKVSEEIKKSRGRPLFYPALYSGLGNGSLVELIDGSVKYDFIAGIGTHFFGHSDIDLLSVAIEAASKNVVMHGNLQAGLEPKEFLETLLRMSGDRLHYGWLALSGSFANDNALKLIRQKKSPAYKVIAFKNCFHGRTVMMSEITDHEGYRRGLHRYGDVFYIPFYDPAVSMEKSVQALKEILKEQKHEIAAFVFELVQGEGGFNEAPREFFVKLMDICCEEKIAIWIDEVQTVGRTGELFAFQKLKLDEYVDVVTVGKMLQNCATLYTEAFNPQPELLAGTFSGSTTSLAVGKRILERLEAEKFFGPKGKISQLEKWAILGLKEVQGSVGEAYISHIRAVGGMVSWQYRDGSLEHTKKFVLKAFGEGIMLFYCGRGPYRVRFLLPAGSLTESQYKKAMRVLERTLKKMKEE